MVTLYSQPGCQPCRLTKMQMDKLGLDYTVVDIKASPEGLARVQELGYQSTPVTVVGEDHWGGYKPDRLKALVK